MTSERVAAVTGAASGIGRATALALSHQGARVALCDRNAAGLAEVAKIIREQDAQTRVLELDVSDQGQAARAIDGIVQDWGRLDVLVNAAGVASSGRTSRGPVIGITEQDWDRILDVNLLGTVYCAQAAARHMMRQRSGRIVNIASIAGAIPRINAAAYSVSKAGVRMFTKCLALELARHGITVNAIAPGPIDTPMLGPEGDQQVRARFVAGSPEIFRLGVPLGKLGKPEDVASAIVYLVSEEAHHVTGAILNVDGMAQLS
ncbi:MAG TPA: SDR family NAD(P)-dependent oxidoreductase [Methylomirabilota bacterium]|jgi:2,3-dihydro-2,3-dihydroxybenzoate dehydrogenase|nr:SDR family NAD(P)-dependent oxidoreductase [Methylomirabilota bacterium]